MRTLQVYMRHLFALQVDLKQLSFSTDDTSGKSSCSQCETFFVWIDLWVTVYFPFASCTAPIQPFGSHPPTHHCVCPQNQSLAWSSTGSSPGNSSQISRFIPGHLREVGHTEESQIQTILILQIDPPDIVEDVSYYVSRLGIPEIVACTERMPSKEQVCCLLLGHPITGTQSSISTVYCLNHQCVALHQQ